MRFLQVDYDLDVHDITPMMRKMMQARVGE